MKQKDKTADGKDVSKADLTHEEDMSFAIMNLIGIEEHLAMTSVKAKNQEYLHILCAVRKLRIKLLKELVKEPEGEIWCVSKHLLSATMRLMETATKYLETDVNAAHDFEKSAFDLYSLFWLVRDMQDKKIVDKTAEKEIAASAAEEKI